MRSEAFDGAIAAAAGGSRYLARGGPAASSWDTVSGVTETKLTVACSSHPPAERAPTTMISYIHSIAYIYLEAPRSGPRRAPGG